MGNTSVKWRLLYDSVLADIGAGIYPPGSALPKITEMVEAGHGSINTVSSAYQELENAGYIVKINQGSKGRNGFFVRHRTVVRIPVSRYSKVLAPDSTRGPWETATAEQGLTGRMETRGVALHEAPPKVAEHLGLNPGAPVVCRDRRALLGDEDVVMIQRAWYSADIASAVGLDGPGKVEGGVLAAMNRAGMLPSTADERITARRPTPEEASELEIGVGVPVLDAVRVLRDEQGQPVELLHIVGAADRLEFVYSDLPISGLG